jgi:hypothetical protein
MNNSGGGDLQSKYESNSAWADRIAFLIIVGLAVDIAAVFILKKELLDGALTIVANALIAAGVWGELWFARRAKEAGDGIVAEAKARAANSMALAAGANSRSSMAQRQVAKANVRAAQLEKETAEAKLELARLQKKITPRVITAEGEAKIIEALKPFPGLPFSVRADPAAEFAFVNKLIAVLQRAGWEYREYVVTPLGLPTGDWHGGEFPDAGISGVQVRINNSRSNEWQKPMEALGFSLTEATGMSVPMVNDPSELPFACSPDVIHIEIARKL